MKNVSDIDLEQLAWTRILLNKVEPRLNDFYTLLLIASDCKGRINLSQRTITQILGLKNGSTIEMINQLSRLRMLDKDYTTTNTTAKVHTLLPINKSGLTNIIKKVAEIGFFNVIEEIKTLANFIGDGLLDIDGIRRKLAVDKLQSSLQTAPRKVYTSKKGNSPMKVGYMFDNNGLSPYYAETNCSPKLLPTTENTGSSLFVTNSLQPIENRKVKHNIRAKNVSNVQHIKEVLEVVINLISNKEDILNNLLNDLIIKSMNTSSTTVFTYVMHSNNLSTEVPIPPIVAGISRMPALIKTGVVEAIATLTTIPNPTQFNTRLAGVIVKPGVVETFVLPITSPRDALNARFRNFIVPNSSDTEKMLYCMYSYNRVVKVLPNLHQAQIPPSLLNGTYEYMAGAPNWMDNLYGFVNSEDWFERWTSGLVRITKNSFLREGTESWKLTFGWMFSEVKTIGSEDGDINFEGITNFDLKVISRDDGESKWYMKYDDKGITDTRWFDTSREEADTRLIEFDSWFSLAITYFNDDYEYPEGYFEDETLEIAVSA